MNLLTQAILATGIFWVGYFIGAIVESNHAHTFLDEEEPLDYTNMQEDTLAYAAPDPVVKKRGRPLGSKNKLKET